MLMIVVVVVVVAGPGLPVAVAVGYPGALTSSAVAAARLSWIVEPQAVVAAQLSFALLLAAVPYRQQLLQHCLGPRAG